MSTSHTDKKLHIKLVSSIAGGGIAEIAALPLCTLKTVYQTMGHTKITDAFRDIYTKRGLSGFYNASVPAILSHTVSTSSKYTIYHLMKSVRKTKDTNVLNNSINGMIGGVCGGLITQPIDVWRVYKQRNQNLFDDFMKNKLTVYQGYRQTIARNLTLYSMLYPLQDFYKAKFGLSTLQGAIATSFTTTMILQPIEYIRINRMAGNKVSFKTDYKNLYKGITLQYPLNLTRFAVQMLTIEMIENKLKQT